MSGCCNIRDDQNFVYFLPAYNISFRRQFLFLGGLINGYVYSMNFRQLLIPVFLLTCCTVHAQHYTAIHGSSSFGSLSVYNNPSSIVNSPYKWDLTLFGMQFQTITNALQGKNFPLYIAPGDGFSAAQGNFARKAALNFNVHLLNARYSLDKNHAIAFGINVRGYTQANSSTIDYTDSVKGPRSFLFLNEKNRTLDMRATSSAWMEIYGSYGLTVFDRTEDRLTAGATIKIFRGMSGAFAQANDVRVDKAQVGDQNIYTVSNGNARYGYSANHGDGSSFKASDLFTGSKMSAGIDLGVEYTIKSQAVTSVYDVGSESDYEWKVGLSLLDLGSNKFAYGSQSRSVSGLRDSIASDVLQSKFFSVQNLQGFNDSLATIVNQMNPLTGNFTIANPARAVINVDRYLSGNFFLNAELSVTLTSKGKSKPSIQETNLIAVTPRWETRKLGFYLPVQYLREGSFWIGGALKAGPLLLGTHNLLNAFSKKKDLSGGGYLAIILRPSSFIKDARSRQYDCPTY